ncbi:MAG: hypothetical protein KYX67_03845 [Brevundimonas sp.]|uniref:hypothetical protein n=1 Tax=Brevundimonas sp. TaxID=1871086 RepID=UPI0025668F7C|nr:hypothetical protein [Brevundimonas sp.]MDK2746431.1 hypothetical protein [Brevundimonas sp.]
MSEDIIVIDEEEIVLPDNDAEQGNLKDRLDQLQIRCAASNLDFQQFDDADFGLTAQISLPSGKEKRRIFISTLSRAESILSIAFEEWRFIPRYEAIWNPAKNYIEAAIQTTRLNADSLAKKILEIPISSSISADQQILINPPNDSNQPAIEIGRVSQDFTILGSGFLRYSFKMKNVRAKTSAQAVEELNSYANSLFFQIDLIHGYSFTLNRERRRNSIPLSKKRKRGVLIEYPSTHFNDDAMSLYWYGKSARGMPLLQYLAFYQCIEFYFPRYSQIEARKRVSSLLKKPTFRKNKDDDLDAIISAAQSAQTQGFGGERNQLRSVINECISAEDIRTYLNEDKERLEHFSGGGKSKFHKIPIANKNLDLRNDVADRIYDIRCKIVHTKNSDNDDAMRMILPFSEDADYLIQDVELAEFISRSVLSSSSFELM